MGKVVQFYVIIMDLFYREHLFFLLAVHISMAEVLLQRWSPYLSWKDVGLVVKSIGS